MNNHKIFIITEYFYPSTGATSQLVTELVRGLTENGLNITVLTTTPQATNYTRFDTISFSHNRSINSVTGKLTRGLSFFYQLTLWGIRNLDRHSTLLIFSNPPFIGIYGALFRVFKGTPYVFVLQDLFPRSAIFAGILPAAGIFTQLWKLLIGLSCKLSNETILLSESMKTRALSEYGNIGKMSVISNWALNAQKPTTHVIKQFQQRWQTDGNFVVLYSGNFGRLHDFLTLLECARISQSEKIKYIFVGTGAKAAQIKTYKSYYHLDNVIIDEPQDLSSLNSIIAISDICAVSLAPGSDDTVAPSKLYGILANQKPILLVASPHADLSRLVVEKNIGICAAPGDIQGLHNQLQGLLEQPQILQQMGKNALSTYNESYGYKSALKHYNKVLATINSSL